MQTINLSFSLFIIPFGETFVVSTWRYDEIYESETKSFSSSLLSLVYHVLIVFFEAYNWIKSYRQNAGSRMPSRGQKIIHNLLHWSWLNANSRKKSLTFILTMNTRSFFADGFLVSRFVLEHQSNKNWLLIDISKGMIDFHAAVNTGLIHISMMAI